MFSTVVSSTAANTEVWKRMVTSRNSSIQVMLDQEDDPELYDECLTDDERLANFRKSRDKIVGGVKVSDLKYFQ